MHLDRIFLNNVPEFSFFIHRVLYFHHQINSKLLTHWRWQVMKGFIIKFIFTLSYSAPCCRSLAPSTFVTICMDVRLVYDLSDPKKRTPVKGRLLRFSARQSSLINQLHTSIISSFQKVQDQISQTQLQLQASTCSFDMSGLTQWHRFVLTERTVSWISHLYITADGGSCWWEVRGEEEEEEGGEEEGGRLVLVRCLVSVETNAAEKSNYLFLAKDENRMLEQRRCCKCVTRTKNILFRLAAEL